MHILVLSNCAVVESQGSGYVIVNTAESFRSLGHSVVIIPPSAFKVFSFLKSKAHIYRMALGMGLWVFKNRKSIPNYQLIFVYGAEFSLALYILKRVLKINIPVILHSNGLELHVDFQMSNYKKYLVKKEWYHINKSFLFRYCYEQVDYILTVSRYDLDFAISNLRVHSSRIFFNEPCLPETFITYNHITEQKKKKIITYCGTWIARKGIASIKEVMPFILRRYPGYIFRIIGVGPEFRLKDHFSDDIIEKIEVYPLVNNKIDLIHLYAESSIFLSPSFYESFGLVVAEAMFCRCAVITGRTGFGASLKNNEEAIVLQIPDATHLIEALEKLITNDALRLKIASKGRERTELLQWSNYRVQLNQIIDKFLKS